MSNARTAAAGIAATLVPAANVDAWLPARCEPPLEALPPPGLANATAARSRIACGLAIFFLHTF
jgi:hypothetical protein